MVLGLFGLKTNGRIRIEFPSNFESTSTVCVVEDVRVPEMSEIWIWSLYYAKQLFNLGRCPHSEGLRETLHNWALENIEESLGGFPGGFTNIDKEIKLIGGPVPQSEKYELKVISKGENLPSIKTDAPLNALQNRAAYSVIALAEFFARTRNVNAVPFVILKLHEYFLNQGDYTELRTLSNGPLYALDSFIRFVDGEEPNRQLGGEL